jgi:predicted O-methyltransferase YrrM
MSAPPDLPEIVDQARQLSHRRGFVRSCRNETGRLLAAMAASKPGALAETGTGCGVGTAWLCSGMGAASRLITAEHDASLATAVREVFAGQPAVTVLEGDWGQLAEHAPFSLLFLDVREAKIAGPDTPYDLVEPGGLIVLDDFTPSSGWPPIYQGRIDAVRQQWLIDPRFTTAEVMVAHDSSVLLAARR